VIGILNRWRQFGRRYFWPHLLLGMVAASLGLPTLLPGSAEQDALSTPSSSLNRLDQASAGQIYLLRLQEAHRRPSFNVDYWQQHALRTVIRHLSFALAPQTVYTRTQEAAPEPAQPLQVEQLALLNTLNTLLTHEPKPPTIIRRTQYALISASAEHDTGLWVAQVQGIRAGPIFFS